MIKFLIKKLLKNTGYEVRKKPKFGKILDYDDIYKSKKMKTNQLFLMLGPIRSIYRKFSKIFKSPKIFAFEPNPEVCD